jgi:hypothetical protein
MQFITANYQRINNWVNDDANSAKIDALKASAWIGTSVLIQNLAISYFRLHLNTAFTLHEIQLTFKDVRNLTALGIVFVPLAYWYPAATKVCRIWAMFGAINLWHEMCWNTFVHEMGHAMTRCALYLPSRDLKNPIIVIELFKGGMTKAPIAPLSWLGNRLGENRAKVLYAAGGALTSLVYSMGMFGLSSYKKNTIVAGGLMIHGAIQLMSEWAGARSGASNDYEVMQKLGGITQGHVLGMLVTLPAIQLAWINRTRLRSLVNRLKP